CRGRAYDTRIPHGAGIAGRADTQAGRVDDGPWRADAGRWPTSWPRFADPTNAVTAGTTETIRGCPVRRPTPPRGRAWTRRYAVERTPRSGIRGALPGRRGRARSAAADLAPT